MGYAGEHGSGEEEVEHARTEIVVWKFQRLGTFTLLGPLDSVTLIG
jgi:hypothetical protein